MKKIITKIICITVGLVLINQASLSQGFINLDFEQAKIVVNPSGMYPDSVYASLAIPGWTAYINGTQVDDIILDTVPLDAAEVTFQGINSDYLTPIQGNFSVALFGSSIFGPQASAAIGQTGQIPVTAETLIFWANIFGSLQVSFDGQMLDCLLTGSTATYGIYSADISAFAGQTGELLFTAQMNSSALLDNIQFSNIPVPEPGTWSLLALGATFIGFSRLTRRKL